VTADEDTPPTPKVSAPDSEIPVSHGEAAQVAPPAPRVLSGLGRELRRRMPWIAGFVLLAAVAWAGPGLLRALSTVSTDDAYVEGHATFVAPRVAGQVARVLVDDNNRVHRGDVLVQLDREPYDVEVEVAEAAVGAAQADLAAAKARARGLAGEARSLRFNLQKAMEGVNDKVALLHAKVAVLDSKRATLKRVQADYERTEALLKSGVASQQAFDSASEARRVAQAEVRRAEEEVYQVRVALGLPADPGGGRNLTQVPPALEQSYSAVKVAQTKLMQVASQLGVTQSFDSTPQQMIDEFYKRDPEGNIDRILDQLVSESPIVKQAEAKVVEAQRNLEQAQLHLRYCDVVSEIDGVVTRRNVNPGNYVVVGQALMAVRSLSEIWVDANFKETQLADLRIGQPVDIDVDMYGSEKKFRGRISGFTMGTGSTLALLPPENATGNFVKVVQRLPVRIDLVDYDPDQTPLFIGLSVTPYVRIHEAPGGPDAGRVLQPYVATAGAPPLPPETAAAPATEGAP